MSDKWLRAAAIGSIWASVEIIAGSFLHNIRFPFAGTILSFFAVILMVAFLRIWPVRGVIWRAALICALMKSISPSAVILGPMTGILMEGLLMEAGILIFGLNRFGLAVGGMLAVFSALIHKALNLLILYGWDLARLLDNLVRFAAKQMRAESIDGLRVLLLLGGVYLMAGLAASLLGVAAARRAQASGGAREGQKVSEAPGNTLFAYSDPGAYSVWVLIFHFLAIIALLVTLIRVDTWWSMLLPLPYLVFCYVRYKRSLRQLLRPRLWIQLVLITFLAALFLSGMQSGKLFDPEGVRAGVMMNVRALLILTGFSAISTEMKNPVIRAILYRRGFAPLYRSLSLAFAVLPGIMEEMGEGNRRPRRLRELLVAQLLRADQLFEHFRNLDRIRPGVTIITGDRGEGKTTLLLAKIDELKRAGALLAGFVAVGIQEPGGIRTGYRIRQVMNGEEVEFCTIGGEPDWERVGRFRINPLGLAKGMEWLAPEAVRSADVVVIDELGPLELSGRGWARVIERILKEDQKPMIWTVRRQLLKKMCHKWNVGRIEVIDPAQARDQ
ncbi:MAG: nucleoside-triphosphatase [Bacteroidales bacterium]